MSDDKYADHDSSADKDMESDVERSMEVAIREERAHAQPPANVLPSEREWEASLALANKIANTPFVPDSYRGNPESVLAAILTGREMGIGPMQSLRQIHMIDGRPAFSADLMLAKMRHGGIVILESGVNDERAWIKARRSDTGETTEVEWTWKEAEEAGLAGKKNWRTYRRDMLWARCVGRLARRLGSDLLGGLVYAAEEMRDDWGDGDYGSGYAGLEGKGYQARKAFHPERETLDGAPKTIADMAAVLKTVDPNDGARMKDMLAAAVAATYDKPVSGLEGDDREFALRRSANALAYLRDTVLGGADFPPPTEEQARQAIAFAFDGFVPELPPRENDGDGEDGDAEVVEGEVVEEEEKPKRSRKPKQSAPPGAYSEPDEARPHPHEEQVEGQGDLLSGDVIPEVDESIEF